MSKYQDIKDKIDEVRSIMNDIESQANSTELLCSDLETMIEDMEDMEDMEEGEKT